MSDDKPNLGLATTRQLLDEIKARGDTSMCAEGKYMSVQSTILMGTLSESTLEYRTVDS